jgi:MinD superfamily P-loop ATPase
MDRKDFIRKGAGVLILGGLTLLGVTQEPDPAVKKFTVISKRCDGCGHCFKACRDKALVASEDGKPVIDSQKCKGCGDCVRFCRRMAIVEQKSNE